MKNEPLVIERILNAPADVVWKAITNLDQMRKWYFDVSDFKPVLGFEFQFKGGNEDRVYVHLGRITEVGAGKKLQYGWRYDGYECNSCLTFELFAEGDKTRLRLTHEGLDSFSANGPDFARNNFEQGWNHIVGISLREFVEKEKVNLS